MKKPIALIITLLTVMSSTLMAHHGTTGQFDASKIIEISGVISDIAYVNPHSYVYVDVTDKNGKVATWNCELRSSSVMNRSGWKKEMFANGTRVDIVGVASRREKTGCYVETISFNGGPVYERYQQIEENQREPETARPKLTPWGVPYLGGDWAAEQRLIGAISGPNAASGPPSHKRGGVELTMAGEMAKAKAIPDGDNITGRLDCSPRDFFLDWVFDQLPNGIYQGEDRIIMKYGFMGTVRTIHLNMDEHPDDIKPSWAGHSIGYWDDDVLVVDTIGFTEHVGTRMVRSEKFHTVERFTLNSKRGSLTRSYEAEDPLFWATKQSGEDIVFLSDYPYEPYNCDDRSVE